MINAVFLGFVFYFGLTITFHHENYLDILDWNKYSNHKETYKKIIDDTDSNLATFIYNLKATGLNNEATDLERILDIKKSKLIAYKERKIQLKEEYSILGYESKKIFWYEIGRSLFSLLIVITLLFVVFNPETIKTLKYFVLIGSLGFLYVSFFWIYHNLFVEKNYHKAFYDFSYIVLAIVSVVITILVLIYIRKRAEKKLENQKEMEELILNGNKLVEFLKPDTF